jgi:hypothetical protein
LLILQGTIFARGHPLGRDYLTCQWSFDPHFSCNLTSNQSKRIKQSERVTMVISQKNWISRIWYRAL